MTRIVAGVMLAIICACNEPATQEHAHTADGLHPGELPSKSYTLYSDSVELFVELKPLIVGKTSRFAAHVTRLGERFLPLTEGSVTVSLVVGSTGLKNTADIASSPGIFRPALQPTASGKGKLIFDIQTTTFQNRVEIDDIPVYRNEDEALANAPAQDASGDITYLKEQAWKTEFANAPVIRREIHDVVRTTGQILPAPGDEVTVSAMSNGIVRFQSSRVLTGAPVKSGETLFSLKGGQVPFENIEATLATSRAELAISKTEYERAAELIKDRLITQADFNSAKLRYETAQINLNNLNRNYGQSGRAVKSPIAGFIRSVLVTEGQFVDAGQPLASITKNQKLLLRADVSLRDAGRVQSVAHANFTLVQNKQTFNTRQLNGRVITSGKVAASNSPFIQLQFAIDGHPSIIAGSYADVYLITSTISNALVVPSSALVEEQGSFYVYVQTGGESFQKREVKPGISDGINVQVLSGISEGERVVTKGAFQIKLSSASGALPAHGHEH
jgi:membrane fusion protein, heavy metal efflux system